MILHRDMAILQFLGKLYYVTFDLWHELFVYRLWCCCIPSRRLNFLA